MVDTLVFPIYCMVLAGYRQKKPEVLEHSRLRYQYGHWQGIVSSLEAGTPLMGSNIVHEALKMQGVLRVGRTGDI